MSSVLRALQKVEYKNSEESYLLTWRLRQRRDRSRSIKTQFVIFMAQVSAAALAALLLIGIGWFILSKNPTLMHQLFPGLLVIETAEPQFSAKPTSRQPSSEQAVIVVDPVLEPFIDSLENHDIIIERDLLTSSELPLQSDDTNFESDTTDESLISHHNTLTPETHHEQPASSPIQKPGTPTASIKAHPLAGLKLQALAWSDDPNKRVALINDIVVRTGRYAHGFKISYIGRDHVVLEKHNTKWKLGFEAE